MHSFTSEYLLCAFAAAALHESLQTILHGKSKQIYLKNIQSLHIFATGTRQHHPGLLSLHIHLQHQVLESTDWSRFGRIWRCFLAPDIS